MTEQAGTTIATVSLGGCDSCKGTGSRIAVRDTSEPGKNATLEYLDFQSKNPIGPEWVRVPCAICKGTGSKVRTA